MHPLREAADIKGSPRFTRAELVGILSFRLRLMEVSEAKKAVDEWISSGLLIEEEPGIFRISEELLEEEERKGDVFEDMLNYVSSSLGWDREDILNEVEKLSSRYGYIDRKLALYLLGVEKGLDMEKFRERISI